MLRSSAKNHKAVTVCVDPSRYGEIIADMKKYDGATSHALRRSFAAFFRFLGQRRCKTRQQLP